MTPINVLILMANPAFSEQAPLRLREEMRQIKEALQRSKYRNQFEVAYEPAARTTDLQQALLDHRPKIVHFSGHGRGEEGLILETDSGKQQLVRAEALSHLFATFDAGEIECVILNSCYSEVQAEAIHRHIDCVIGMNQAIGDKAAVNFAEGFYRGLGAGLDYDRAFEMACSAIDLSGSDDGWTPELMYRQRADAIAPALRADLEAESKQASPSEPVATAPPAQAGSSQSVGNISVTGNDNPFNVVQGAGDVNIDQSRTQTTVTNPDLQLALEALGNLKQAIAATDELSGTDKKMAAIPIEELEEELQQPEPKEGVINQAFASLNNALDKATSLAGPVTEVVKLVAKVGVLLV